VRWSVGVFIIFALAIFSPALSAQKTSGSTQMSQATGTQSPQMPEIPAIPSVPRVPAIPSIPSVSPMKSGSSGKTGTTGKDSSTGSSGAANSAGTKESSGLSSLSLLQALSGSAFGGEGEGLEALSSLLGGGTSTSGTDSETLKKILQLLEKSENQAAGVSATTEATPLVAQPLATTVPIFERLVINKVNILSTITQVIPSAITSNGSFLITGERIISARDGLSEIFYFMCRSLDGEKYMLNVDLTQAKENPQSYLYQLVRKSPLEGKKTGDLVVFRFSESEWQSDIVIRLPSALVQ